MKNGEADGVFRSERELCHASAASLTIGFVGADKDWSEAMLVEMVE